jgi:hypothetical protein
MRLEIYDLPQGLEAFFPTPNAKAPTPSTSEIEKTSS